MTQKEYIEKLSTMDWDFYKNTEREDTQAVPHTLECFLSAQTSEEVQQYQDQLFSLLSRKKTKHYFPVVIPALPFLFSIALSSQQEEQRISAGHLLVTLASYRPLVEEFKGMDADLLDQAFMLEYNGYEEELEEQAKELEKSHPMSELANIARRFGETLD